MKTKKIVSAILAGVMIISSVSLLSACGETASQGSAKSDQSSESKSESEEAKQKEFDFSKIEWTTSREREDGELQQVIEFTNNSDYPILKLKITFEQKADTTAEDLKVFDQYVTEEKIKKDKVSDIYIVGSCDKFIKQGESNTGSLNINDSYSVKKEEQFSIMEPSEAKVEYVDGDKLYEVEYNYLTKKSKVVGDPKPAFNWSETLLGEQIPKLDCIVTYVKYDRETNFNVTGYDYSKSKADEYIQECISRGFVKNINSSGKYWTYLYKDSYKLRIQHHEEDNTISVNLETDKTVEATTQKATQ